MTEFAQPPINSQVCLLDRERLKKLEVMHEQTLHRLDTILSLEGPIVNLRERVALVERATEAAHVKLDGIVEAQGDRDKKLNSLAVKLAALSALISSTTVAAILKFLE